MSDSTPLKIAHEALEDAISRAVRAFETETGWKVKALKVHPSSKVKTVTDGGGMYVTTVDASVSIGIAP